MDQINLTSPAIIPVGTTPVKLCSHDERRAFCRIQNQGGVSVLLGDETNQFSILAAGFEEPFAEGAPINEVWAKTASGTANVMVWEGRRV